MNIYLLKKTISQIIESDTSTSNKLQQICNYLKHEISYYDWVGFYFKNEDKQVLKLAEFAGEATEHIIIPFGKGICGQVAISNQNFIVPDVSSQDNYISCGLKVKSEIVIPIFVKDENVGQIDIDSHSVNPFSKNDEILLAFVCEKVAEIL
jgi:GAF domain-containing protein